MDCQENYLSDAESDAEIENREDLVGIDADYVEDMADMADEDVDEETREYRAARREFMQRLPTQTEHYNIISLAGPLADSWHVRKPLFAILEGGGASDYAKICAHGGLTNAMLTATTDLLEKEWATVLLVASALMERTTLSYQDFLEVIFEANWVAEDVALGIRDAPPGYKAAWP